MKFKKKDLRELVEKCQNDPQKLYDELEKIEKEVSEFNFVLSDCDNLLNYRDGYVNIEFRNKKWHGCMLFFNGRLDDLTIHKN